MSAERLQEQLRSILSIHVDNRADVPRILKLIMLTIREEQQDGPQSQPVDGEGKGP